MHTSHADPGMGRQRYRRLLLSKRVFIHRRALISDKYIAMRPTLRWMESRDKVGSLAPSTCFHPLNRVFVVESPFLFGDFS